jgi:hypothetical protein
LRGVLFSPISFTL